MWRFCLYFLIFPLVAGCSPFTKQHHKPTVTLISNGNECDVSYLPKPLPVNKFDPLQSAYNYAKSDIVASIFFDFNRAYIDKKRMPQIEAASDFFLKNPSLKILVIGHCDHFGTAAYNNLLGHRRAENVRTKLLQFGLSESRIVIASVGSEQAAEGSLDKNATLIDRRADIVLFRPVHTSLPTSGEQDDGEVAED
ncbi:MAG: OmpA family protein [Puniceicoccales bacterium]|jgi:peptidoglycan-associated lipoprotein|nr:OmpA family protein [Puniceicoccales bacterium]